MHMSVLPENMLCAPHLCSTRRGQKRTSEPLELELQMVVTHPVGAGKQTQVLQKSSKCSPSLQLLTILFLKQDLPLNLELTS